MNCYVCREPAPRVSTAPAGRYARRVHRDTAICHGCFIDLMRARASGSAEVEAHFDATVERTS